MTPLGRSDHSVIFCPSSSKVISPKVTIIHFRQKSPAACANFRYDLSKSSFLRDSISMTDTNSVADLLTAELYKLFCKHFPLPSVRSRSDDKPWIKPSLKLLINQRDRAYSQKKTAKYLRLREAVISHVRKLKKEFLHSQFQRSDSSSTWKAVNKLTNRRKYVSCVHDANELKNVFSSVYSATGSSPFSLNLDNLPSIPLSPTLRDIQLLLQKLKKGSQGPDGIPFWILRDHRDLLAPSFHHLISLSVQTKVFPDCFKRAFVTPIPKCTHPMISDYRPISLSPVSSKVLERLVYRQWFLSIIPKIDSRQFAFVPRTGQGTTTALTYLVHHILSFLDTPGCVRLLMIDYSKAFDRLPHPVILNSLVELNAPKELVLWISSYLENRSQCVKLFNSKSDWFHASSGVPQGSTLAPFLFAVVINSLKPKLNNSMIIKFADDIAVLHFVRHNSDDNLSEEFKHISRWSVEHGLQLNPAKTKLLNFQTKRSISMPPLTDHTSGLVIELVSTAKLLGLTLDNNLRWEDHLQNTLSRMRKRMYILYVLREANAPPEVLWNVYCAMIRSLACYAYPAWCNMSSSRFQKLITFEKRVCRIFGLTPKVTFSTFCANLAKRLVSKATLQQHPLNFIFDFNATRYSTRLGRSHRKIKCNTKRFTNSFIRFTCNATSDSLI